MCFSVDAFDVDTFQRAILYQKEGYLGRRALFSNRAWL